MRRIYYITLMLLISCMGLPGRGIALAQTQDIDLSQFYRSPGANNLLAFNYPAGWVITEETNFVTVSDPDSTLSISFYTTSLTESIINISPDEREGVRTFFQIAGVNYTSTETTVILQNQTVVGAFQLNSDTSTADYALLGIGRGFAPPGWIYIHVTGSAIEILGGVDTFMAIINTFGTLQTVDGSTTSQQPSAVITNVPDPIVPCLIRAIQANSTQIRVGPGTNRGVLRFLDANQDFTVVGTANANDSSRWWRLNKNEAAPGQAANETWVADSQVTTSGDCDRVGTVMAPPIIRQRPTAVPTSTGGSNTGGGQATPDPGSTQLFIDFSVSAGRIREGTCTDLRWDVRNAREVRLDGSLVQSQGTQTVCPVGTAPFSVDYFLDVIDNTGVLRTETVFIQIDSGFVQCGIDYIPFSETATVSAGSENYHYIYLDPCEGPRTIFIEMYANNNDGLDPYLDVFIDDIYYGSDDDSGGNLNSYIVVNIPAGSNYISLTAKGYNFETGGSYEIYAEYMP